MVYTGVERALNPIADVIMRERARKRTYRDRDTCRYIGKKAM